LVEGSLIGLVGAVIGVALGLLLLWVLARVGISLGDLSGMGELTALMGSRLYPAVDVFHALNRGVVVVFIAALASLYPAWHASRQEPAEALHYV
jgi:lipoprotein-releasing system permease protein